MNTNIKSGKINSKRFFYLSQSLINLVDSRSNFIQKLLFSSINFIGLGATTFVREYEMAQVPAIWIKTYLYKKVGIHNEL